MPQNNLVEITDPEILNMPFTYGHKKDNIFIAIWKVIKSYISGDARK